MNFLSGLFWDSYKGADSFRADTSVVIQDVGLTQVSTKCPRKYGETAWITMERGSPFFIFWIFSSIVHGYKDPSGVTWLSPLKVYWWACALTWATLGGPQANCFGTSVWAMWYDEIFGERDNLVSPQSLFWLQYMEHQRKRKKKKKRKYGGEISSISRGRWQGDKSRCQLTRCKEKECKNNFHLESIDIWDVAQHTVFKTSSDPWLHP